MTEAILKHDNDLLLDQPFLKVPYEVARKTFKSAQRNIERDREYALPALHTAALAAAQTPKPAIVAEQTLDNMIQRMEILKRKLSSLQQEEQTNHRQTRARISHLQDLHLISSPSPSPEYKAWSRTRLNRLLVDYLLRSGYCTSAKALAAQTNITDLVDIPTFETCLSIEGSLKQGRLQEALAWCAENKPALKKLDNGALETELRMQQYVELLRARGKPDIVDATRHARKYLASMTSDAASTPADEGSPIPAAGMLAFKSTTTAYAPLYAPSRYTHLAAVFLKTHHALLSLPTQPALHTALSAGLSALKTPSCHSRHAASSGTAASTSTRGEAGICPICSTELNELARGVPWANRTNSIVESEPVVLPNGRVYGLQRLRRLNEGVRNSAAGQGRSVSRDISNGARDYRNGSAEEEMDVDYQDDEERETDDEEVDEEEGFEEEHDLNEEMSVKSEEEDVPGGLGSVRDPMPPGDWFEWRDVRKVFIM